jgi:RHH-type proline utilization regulon transcriptional repressor/proline dehydrogenase/delta 1-pyrroline-5-carboxylate dehydrogenase
VVADIHAGNIYVNRNQIGAVVGSQPFGGEGLSGTGPKAGGPQYLARFTQMRAPLAGPEDSVAKETGVQQALRDALPSLALGAQILPGPTGESNRLIAYARPPVLCLGPSAATAKAQAQSLRALGGQAVESAGLDPTALTRLQGFSAVMWWGDAPQARILAQLLSQRSGAIVPLICDLPDSGHALMERHICIDTTASGGNAQLLAGV